MGPSKRKGSVRRPVLDLNTRDDSPSRPTWQTKYQQIIVNEEVHENGDATSQTTLPQKKNVLSGLVGNYNSDSDSEETEHKPNSALDAKVEDFLKEIHSISVETTSNTQQAAAALTQPHTQQGQEDALYPASVTAWQQCYDHNSGYPYYWNTETNEVTWEMPPELKAALTSIALKQQEKQKQEQTKKHEMQQPKEVAKKKVVKYPWQTESDSEDEKIEMITSFGPQSGEESDEDNEKDKKKKTEKNKKVKVPSCSKYPLGPSAPSMDPAKIRSDSLALEDPEAMNETLYETSSLLTHGVQDTGPPGDENFQANKESAAKKKVNNLTVKKESQHVKSSAGCSNSGPNSVNKTSSVTDSNAQRVGVSTEDDCLKSNDMSTGEKPALKGHSIADNVIAQIEKETPPNYEKEIKSGNGNESTMAGPEVNIVKNKPSGIALIANYGDDSEPEDNNSFSENGQKYSKSVKIPTQKTLFPIEIPQEKEEKTKPLFPCMDVDATDAAPIAGPEFVRVKESSTEEVIEPTNIYNVEPDVSDSTSHKAFKRKKRLEFATTVYGPSTSKVPEVKLSSPERSVPAPTTQYNMDPSMNEHRGFGFSSLRAECDTERKTFKNYGGIQFVKAEIINSSPVAESKEKSENENEVISAPGKSQKDLELEGNIEDAAALLREKVTFLTGGSVQIPPIQYMAIELEILVLAWQQGALSPPYLSRWLNEKCAELTRHEKSAAPTGWTCLWDRKNKRYYYRNSTTKATQWEYPTPDEKAKGKEGDVVGGGDEMDICDTPPHMSPIESEKQSEIHSSTPPPSTTSDAQADALRQSPTLQPPPPPKTSHRPESEPTVVKTGKKRKRKLDVVQTASGDIAQTAATAILASYKESAKINEDAAPPLPPMPPPPPPPPDEPPPPLPDSPPPLPLDPDQPLPPGVDEPEYTLYRRTSPKHSYKKAQVDSSAYSTELMMSYGYGLPVQQVVSTNAQPIAMPMQALEYHTYMPDSVSTPYLVQSAPTSHVIQCSAKKPKVSLNSELMSFYSDLAMLDDAATENSNSETQTGPSAAPSQKEPVVVTTITVTMPASVTTTTHASSIASTTTTTTKTGESFTSNGLNVKKKKKSKTTTGLALKKKGVSSLVAKWQQVQQEVRRDFSDDEDDETDHRSSK